MHLPLTLIIFMQALAGTALGHSSTTPDERSTDAEPVRPVQAYADPVIRSQVRESAIEGLLAYSLSENALLRANAIEAVSAAVQRAVPIVRAGLADENAGVRFSAAMVAGENRLQDTAPQLRSLLSDSDPRVRFASIYALHALEQPIDLTPLADAMYNDSPEVRATAAFVLGEIGEPSAIPVLTEFASRPLPPEVSRTKPTTQAILRLQVAEALLKLGHEDVRHVVHAALYPRDREGYEAAALAAQILGDLGDATSIAQLVSVVERSAGQTEADRNADAREVEFLNPPELRLAAATALARMGEFGGVYVADQYLGHESPAIRAQCAFLYGAAGRDLDLLKLEAMLTDPNPLVRVSAMAGIVTITEG